jgi:hypothetical protein
MNELDFLWAMNAEMENLLEHVNDPAVARVLIKSVMDELRERIGILEGVAND